jgi:hypothetical protein
MEHTMMDSRLLDGSMQEFGNRIMTTVGTDPEMERLALDRILKNFLATKARRFPDYVGGFDVVVYDDPMRRYRTYGWMALVPTKDVLPKTSPYDQVLADAYRGVNSLCGCVDPFAAGVIHSDTGPCVTKCRCSLCAAKR